MIATKPLRAGLHRVLGTCVFLMLLLPCAASVALDRGRSVHQFHHTAWTVKDGAPGQVTALAQSTDGFLWLATQTGLFRFDGVRFEAYAPPAGTALPATSVAALFAPASGGVWVGFRYGAVSFVHDGKLTNYGEEQGLPTGTVFGFAQDQQGTLWAANFQGLLRLKGSRWETLGPQWKYPGKQARAVFVDRAGTLWVATETVLAYLPRGAKEFRTINEPVGRISQISQAPDGAIWIAETDGSVRPISQAPAQQQASPGIALASAGLLFDRDGSLWATSLGDGIRRLAHPELVHGPVKTGAAMAVETAVEIFREKEGLSADYLLPVLEDREGNIWFGSSRGLDRFRHGNLLPAEFPDGTQDFALVAGNDGAIWAGTRNRPLMRLQDQATQFFDLPPPVTATYRDPQGIIWLGGPKGLWRMADDKPVEITRLPDAIRYSGVQAITRDGSGALWVSLNTPGIYRWAAGKWTHLQHHPALSEGSSPLTLLTDARGRIWMGFARGEITVMQGDDLKLLTARDGLQVGNVTALLQGRKQIWIGGERGLGFSDGVRVTMLAAPEGNPFRGISGMLETGNGDLWLNGAKGVVRIAASEVEKALKQPSHAVRFDLFNFLDGLPGTPAQFRPIPSAVAGSDGRLWFATTSGVVSVDPRRIMRNGLPPPVYIRSLTADGEIYESAQPLHLAAQTQRLQIDYTALSLSIPERVRFRYKLEGFDTQWQDVGTRRTAFYNNPGPGNYRFRVIAANNDGVWNEQGASLDFNIAPRFFQTAWFVALCVVTVLGLLWLAYLLRLRQLGLHIRSRLHERHMERERIARELHDTLLQSIQGLILRFQAVAETIPPREPARMAMERALERADAVLVEGRDRVLDLRASTQYSGSLVVVFEKVAEELAQDHAATFRIGSTGVEQPLDPLVRDELFRIGREALLNAYHHANAENIEVEIDYSRDELRLRFIDDGRGIDARVLEQGGRPGHWGLSGMRERAERIGGRLSIWSRAGAGTEVELRMPAAAAYRPCLKASRWKWLPKWWGGRRNG